MKRYTEGICGDGAAILDGGAQITVSEILNRLNRLDELEQAKVNKLVLADVMPSFCGGYRINIQSNSLMERGLGLLLVHPNDMPPKK